jgi:hypothetical protein
VLICTIAPQLILNVDGCIAVCFVDLLRDSGAFTQEEADDYIKVRPPSFFFFFFFFFSVVHFW